MKTSSIIRIVVWSLVALMLTGFLVAALTTDDFFGNLSDHGFNVGISGYTYSDSNRYKAGNGAVNSADVNSVKIEWISGSVDVIAYDGDNIEFSEIINKDNVKEEDLLHYYLDSTGKLFIRFKKSGFRLYPEMHKALTVKIPQNMTTEFRSFEVETVSADANLNEINANKFEIDSVSAELHLIGINAEEFKFDNVSGKFNIADSDFGHVEISTVSGDISAVNISTDEISCDGVSSEIDISGSIGNFTGDSVGGNIKLHSVRTPDKLNISTVSGDVDIRIPKDSEFTLNYDTVSGDINMDFPSTMSKKNIYSIGSGSARYNIDTVGGDIGINGNNTNLSLKTSI